MEKACLFAGLLIMVIRSDCLDDLECIHQLLIVWGWFQKFWKVFFYFWLVRIFQKLLELIAVHFRMGIFGGRRWQLYCLNQVMMMMKYLAPVSFLWKLISIRSTRSGLSMQSSNYNRESCQLLLRTFWNCWIKGFTLPSKQQHTNLRTGNRTCLFCTSWIIILVQMFFLCLPLDLDLYRLIS